MPGYDPLEIEQINEEKKGWTCILIPYLYKMWSIFKLFTV
jgi:hypothetical protein